MVTGVSVLRFRVSSFLSLGFFFSLLPSGSCLLTPVSCPLFVSITNVGRRPVMVKGWGAIKKNHAPGKRGIFIVPIGLPRMLKEGEYHNEWTPELSFISDDLEKIYVWDSVGREWKISRKNFKYLLATAREGASPETRKS